MKTNTTKLGSRLLAITQRRRHGAWMIAGGLTVATVATYLGGGAKTIFPHFYYITIIVAAIYYGIWGGLLAGLIAGLLCGPAMPLDVELALVQTTSSWLTRTVLFMAAGGLSGAFASVSRANLHKIERLHTRTSSQKRTLETLADQFRDELKRRRAAEEQMRREAERSEILLRVAERFNDHLHLEATLDAICEETAHALDVRAAAVALYDDEREKMKLAATFGLPPSFQQRFVPVAPRPKEGSQESLHIRSDAADIVTLPNGRLYVDHDIQTTVSVTLVYHRKLIGRIYAYAVGAPRSFEDDTLSLLHGIANQAVRAIVNAQLFSEAGCRLDRLRALREIDKTITAGHDLHSTLNKILDQVIQHLGVDAADILLYDESSQSLEFAAGRGTSGKQVDPSPSTPPDALRLWQPFPSRLSPKSFDLSPTGNLTERPQSLEQAGYATYHAVPLTAKGQTKGVLEIFHHAKVTPDAEWLEFLEALAGQAAIAIDNVALFQETSRANREVRRAYDAVIEGWAQALALRDIETIDHTRRVTEMTVRLARRLGVSEAEIVHVRRGAILHDIGKIGIPDEILFKPGPLTEQEERIMSKHPVYAYELIAPIDYLKPAHHIPYYHHERWDGSGYPQGLTGTDIPKAARIFAVTDVFDALTSDRPYRDAWTPEEALAFLKEQSGRLFDPEIVEMFLDMAPILTDFERVYK